MLTVLSNLHRVLLEKSTLVNRVVESANNKEKVHSAVINITYLVAYFILLIKHQLKETPSHLLLSPNPNPSFF